MTTYSGVLVPDPNFLGYEVVIVTKERTENSVKAEVTCYIWESAHVRHPWSYWLEVKNLELNIVPKGKWAEDCGEKGRKACAVHDTYKYAITPESTTITIPVHVYATGYSGEIVSPADGGFDFHWNLEAQLPELE